MSAGYRHSRFPTSRFSKHRLHRGKPFSRVLSAFTLSNGEYRLVPQALNDRLSAPPFAELVIEFKDIFPVMQPMDPKIEAESRKLRKTK